MIDHLNLQQLSGADEITGDSDISF